MVLPLPAVISNSEDVVYEVDRGAGPAYVPVLALAYSNQTGGRIFHGQQYGRNHIQPVNLALLRYGDGFLRCYGFVCTAQAGAATAATIAGSNRFFTGTAGFRGSIRRGIIWKRANIGGICATAATAGTATGLGNGFLCGTTATNRQGGCLI